MIYGTVGTDHQEKQKGRGRGAIWIILPWHPPWRVLGENCLVCMALTSVGARGLLAWMVSCTHTQRTQEALPHKRNKLTHDGCYFITFMTFLLTTICKNQCVCVCLEELC